MPKFIFLYVLLTLPLQRLSAQVRQPSISLTVQGSFLTDSIRIGIPVQYVLTARHHPATEVVFPDSGWAGLGQFEWVRKEFYNTRTQGRVSTDSVVYTLVSFELDSVQRLGLPVFVVRGPDSLAVYAAVDSVAFSPVVRQMPDNNSLRVNTSYQPVPLAFDWTYYGLLGGVGAVLGALVWVVFGKGILRRIRLYRIRLQHRVFTGGFERLRRKLRQENSVSTVADAVVLWKNYMEDLEEKPFSTFTSKEILEMIPDPLLADALREIDRVVYGQLISEDSGKALDVLEGISAGGYRRKRESLRSTADTRQPQVAG